MILFIEKPSLEEEVLDARIYLYYAIHHESDFEIDEAINRLASLEAKLKNS